ncbi:hypothetical protein [Celeribacter naphthalenivorans]|uniref:hypothetical protein n=1 Tax=Celeribacter naphthalenivorans TaxID=1614694 RepID=UPI001CFBAAA6|nr:hypothetical protein [Celeribacter naphthalenivorans]
MNLNPKFIMAVLLTGTFALAGCGAPTVETKRAVTTYRVTGLSASTVTDATVAAVKTRVSSANVQRSVTPASLPAQPGALEVKDALAGSNLGALTGGALVATCDGAMAVIRASDRDFAGYGESTGYTVCVWPYRGGVNVDVYSSFTEKTGGVSPAELGKQLASSAFGNSSQFIGKMHDGIVASLQKAGGTVTKLAQR